LDKASLAFFVLVNQRQRNKAIGIENDPQFLRGMAAYIRSANEKQVRENIGTVVKASYLKSLLEEHQALARRLTDYIMANIEDDEIRNEGVYVMTKLESYVNHLGGELEALGNGRSDTEY
jgi:predicted Ser/Thr protein kinase